jgi:hypothetical protein
MAHLGGPGFFGNCRSGMLRFAKTTLSFEQKEKIRALSANSAFSA